jgi:hypothetical protein
VGRTDGERMVENFDTGHVSYPMNEQTVFDEPLPIVKTVNPRTLPWRFSRLKKMDSSPLQYWQACQSVDDKPTLAMRLGSGTHAIVLDQPVVVYNGIRNGKRWASFDAGAKERNQVVLNPREMNEAQQLADAIRRHKLASELLLSPDVVREQHIDWKLGGRDCSSRPDAFSRRFVADLKTDRNARPDDFQRTAWKMFYPAQLTFYVDAVNAFSGVRPRDAYLVAVEKKAPFDISVHELTDDIIEMSRKTISIWVERLLECEASNYWPGYGAAPFTFEAPTRKSWEISAFEDDVGFEGDAHVA